MREDAVKTILGLGGSEEASFQAFTADGRWNYLSVLHLEGAGTVPWDTMPSDPVYLWGVSPEGK